MLYQGRTLVAPVLSYGMDHFACSENDLSPIIKEQIVAFRKLLRVGSRNAVSALPDVEYCILALIERRTFFDFSLLRKIRTYMQHYSCTTTSCRHLGLKKHCLTL